MNSPSVLKDIFSINILRTWLGIIKNYRKFFSEVLEADWSNKSKPFPFFITCISASLLLAGLAGSPVTEPLWVEIMPELKTSDQQKFEQTFFVIKENPVTKRIENEMYGLGEDESTLRSTSVLNRTTWRDVQKQEYNHPGSSMLSDLIKTKAGGIKTKDIFTHLNKNGNELLALRYEKISNTIKNKKTKVNIFFRILTSIFLVMLFKFMHKMLKVENIKPQQTADVLFYITAVILSLSIIIDSASIKWIKDPNLATIPHNLFIIIITITFFYKVIKHTHSVSFGRMLWATQVPFTVATLLGQCVAILLINIGW